MNNKKLGTDFERQVCKTLTGFGYWVHFMTPDNRGAQPFDIIAVKNGRAFAIECKTLADSKKSFSIDRLEDNQIVAFEKWLSCGNGMPQIWVQHKGEIYVIWYSELKMRRRVVLDEHRRMSVLYDVGELHSELLQS